MEKLVAFGPPAGVSSGRQNKGRVATLLRSRKGGPGVQAPMPTTQTWQILDRNGRVVANTSDPEAVRRMEAQGFTSRPVGTPVGGDNQSGEREVQIRAILQNAGLTEQ